MRADHYESHYDEPVEENMAMEFGLDIVTAIRANAELNPLLHRQLQVTINVCLQRCSQLLEVLDSEQDCLQTAIIDCRSLARQLDEVPDCRIDVMPFDELESHWNQLSDLGERCEQLIRTRQQFIAERRTSTLNVDDHVSINTTSTGGSSRDFRSSKVVWNCSIESAVAGSSVAPETSEARGQVLEMRV